MRIRRRWRRNLIIQLLGRSIGYNLLHRKISELGYPKTTIELVTIDNGFFLAKFSSDEDYEYANLRALEDFQQFNNDNRILIPTTIP